MHRGDACFSHSSTVPVKSKAIEKIKVVLSC